MRQPRSTILLANLTLALSPLLAADLHVSIGGGAGLHPDITSAMAAANDGDRILVQPGTYPAFDVTRTVDVLALSPENGFGISGDVRVYTAPGRRFTLTGAYVMGKLLHPDAGFMEQQVSITAHGCSFLNVETPSGHTYLRLHACTVKGRLVFARGEITGCDIQGSTAHMPENASVVELTSGGPSGNLSQRRYLVGNTIGAQTPPTYTSSAVSLETDAPFTFSNNLVTGAAAPNAKPKVKTKKPKETYMQVTLEECWITSITMAVPGSGSGPWLEDSVSMFQPAFRALVQNNFIVGAQPFTGNATCFQQAYNVVTADPGAIDAVTGQPAAGSPAIDAGDPSSAYLDLDLSRNDAGCWGGSWSMANFQNSGAAPQVMLVQVPRTATAGSLIPVSATAVQR